MLTKIRPQEIKSPVMALLCATAVYTIPIMIAMLTHAKSVRMY